MPVTDSSSTVTYVGNASAVNPYAIPFDYIDEADVKVSVIDEDGVETTLDAADYVVTDDELVTDSAIPATSSVTIYRELDVEQPIDLVEQDSMPVESIETGLNRLTMICQQFREQLSRAITFTKGSDAFSALSVKDQASILFGLDSSGDLALYDVTAILALLNLEETSIGIGSKLFTEATKAAAIPDFVGQIGVSYDAADNGDRLYIGTATTAGSWSKFTAAALGVTTAMLANLGVTTGKIANNAVTLAKIATDVYVTQIFANDAAKTAAVPVVIGQVGFQVDTKVAYYGVSTVAGSWSPILSGAASITLAMMANVTGCGFLGKAATGAAAPAHLTISGLTAATLAVTDSILLEQGASFLKTTPEAIAAFGGSARVLHRASNFSAVKISTTTTTPALDGTTPQLSEGTEVLTCTITPKSASSWLIVTFNAPMCNGSASLNMMFAMFRDSTADAIQAAYMSCDSSNCMTMTCIVASAAASATTFSVRFGVTTGTGYINRSSAQASLFGNAPRVSMDIIEYSA